MCRGDSSDQSLVFFFSKRQVLHMNASTSPHSSLRPVTRSTSSPLYHNTTLPEHLSQSRCAFHGLANHTRLLNLNVLSVSAPTGQTSITFPEKSLSMLFWMYVEISDTSPRFNTPCTRPSVICSATFTQR